MTLYFDAHTHLTTSNSEICAILNLPFGANTPDTGLLSMGIHPWQVHEFDFESGIGQLEVLIKQGTLTAVGEVGLDRAIETPIEVQIKWFKAQCLLAEQYQKPVIVHCVRAWADVLGIRKAIGAKQPWIIHGYNGNITNAMQLIQAGCYLSFGAGLTKSTKLQAVLLQLPTQAILIETDESQISITEMHQFLSEKLQLSTQKFSELIRLNFMKAYGIETLM